MSNFIESQFLEQDYLKKNGGIFHIKNFFTNKNITLVLRTLKKIKYNSLTHKNKISRYENDFTSSDEATSKLKIEVNKIAQSLSIQNYKIEQYCFKYIYGQHIPWHKDTNRHIITAIAYFGVFLGGEYVYKDVNNKILEVKLKQGDILLSINMLPDGTVLNPLHKTNIVKKGIRYCVVFSVVLALELEKNSLLKSISVQK